MANTTSAKVKNRWNAAHYDRITVLVQKGEKEKLSKIAEQEGTTVARLFVDALNAQRPGLLRGFTVKLDALPFFIPALAGEEKDQAEPDAGRRCDGAEKIYDVIEKFHAWSFLPV